MVFHPSVAFRDWFSVSMFLHFPYFHLPSSAFVPFVPVVLVIPSFPSLRHSLNTLIMHTLQSNSNSKTEIPSFSEKGKANSSGKVPPNRLQKPSSCWMQCLVIIT